MSTPLPSLLVVLIAAAIASPPAAASMKLIEAAWQRGEKTKAVLFAKIDARRGNAAARRFLERARDEGYAPAAEALAALPEERGEEGHRVDKSGATAAIPPAPGKVTPEI